MQQDIIHLKGMLDRHTNDLMLLSNNLKNAAVDPNVCSEKIYLLNLLLQK
jgi:hypothetical protein